MSVTSADRIDLWIKRGNEVDLPPSRLPDLTLGDKNSKSVASGWLRKGLQGWHVDVPQQKTKVGAWLIVPPLPNQGGAQPTHPALLPQLWHKETSPTGHSTRMTLTVGESLAGELRLDGWGLPGKGVGHKVSGSLEKPQTDEEESVPQNTWVLAHDTAGQACIWLHDLPLVVGVWPRHLSEVSGNDNPSAEQVWDALQRLGTMVADLRAVECVLEAKHEAQGIAVAEGADGATWRQRLQQIADLVDLKGVASAWASIVNDPVVRIVQEFPVRPVDRAVRPVLHGARGPWTLADGWHPPRADGRVRDRVVQRTVDTPPNRIAVQSAMRVVQRLDSIDAAIRKEASHSELSTGVLDGWQQLSDRLRRQARRVLTAPSLAEVSRTATVALDSPSVQTNARCQPLLRAWRALNRDFAQASPFEAALRDPLGKTHEIYELWCWTQVNAALERVVGSPLDPPERIESFQHAWQQRFNANVRSVHSPNKKAIHTSWSLAAMPDGIVTTSDAFLVWDAKYRAWPPARSGECEGSDFVYQAHAFRDAVRLHGKPDEQACWSLVLFAGAGGHDRYFLSTADGDHGHDKDHGQLALDEERSEGGVGVLRLKPPVEPAGTAHLNELVATLRTILFHR